jgi:hypothetical protein
LEQGRGIEVSPFAVGRVQTDFRQPNRVDGESELGVPWIDRRFPDERASHHLWFFRL